ncbi:MAG: hypothetical protein AUI62_01695 [Thaumarchaeota archaeon 13_1_40CM_2_39_7]|nr:MAG: hypothetical protein AUI62_01695 [Thaumarchaeota archaeon 13_1_40CM_2_39_7]
MVSRGSLEDRLKDIERELEALKIFRITPQLNKFNRNLMGERSFILTANRNRSEKMKRTWRYLKAIQKNYPVKLSLRELRTALRKHRQGLVTDVPDVAWRNPSP